MLQPLLPELFQGQRFLLLGLGLMASLLAPLLPGSGYPCKKICTIKRPFIPSLETSGT